MNALEMIKTKSATELVAMWEDTKRRKAALMFNPAQKDRSEEWDALIQVRIWLAQEMQNKMTDAEFIDVVDE